MDYLLVEPEFPIPNKSKNHKNFLPIGLLKIAAMLENQGHTVRLIRGNKTLIDYYDLTNRISKFNQLEYQPDEIWITSLFTYWIYYVRDSVKYYRKLFPKAKIVVGGIAASLFGKEKTKKITKCDEVIIGTIPEAEQISADKMKEVYDKFLNNVDFQILHAQRGCFRRCKFCGTWKIEPIEIYESSIKNKIFKEKIVFYDNNFLRNPHIHNILDELIELKKKRKIKWCESQSGFDGRLLIKEPILIKKLKLAGFRNIRIAWDGPYKEKESIKEQIEILTYGKDSFKRKELEVFMLYNWDISFDEMELKRVKCFKWGVQIADCRFRPLDQEFDYYNPRKLNQTNKDYHIHKDWTDILVKQFRRNVRRQNICVRRGFDIYVGEFERKSISKTVIKRFLEIEKVDEQKEFLDKRGIKYWDPSIVDTREKIQEELARTKKPKLLH